MIIRHQIDAKVLGKRLAEILQERCAPVQKLWWHESEILPEIWILTEPVDLDELRSVTRALVDLQQCFPDALFDHHLLNPAWTQGYDVANEVPNGAEEIELWD